MNHLTEEQQTEILAAVFDACKVDRRLYSPGSVAALCELAAKLVAAGASPERAAIKAVANNYFYALGVGSDK